MTTTLLQEYAEPMALDPNVCGRAAASHDPRFDGRFFVGVRTTGVYCRPHCPGAPKPENVSYYESREAARAAGLRACLRCRPDAVAWRSGSRPVSRRRRGGRVELPFEEPFDWQGMLVFLEARAVEGVEVVDGAALRRVVRTDAGATVVEVVPVGRGALELRAPEPAAVAETARRALDLDANPRAIAADLAGDPHLSPLVERRPGLRMPGAWDGFEILVRAILGQQVSVAAARTFAGRLVARFGEPLPRPQAGLTHAFPDARSLATARVEEIGLTRARAATLRGAAVAVAGGAVELSGSAEALRARLVELPGIGPWTAAYVAMRALGDPDALPAGDLGVRQALALDGRLPSEREVERRAEPWRPWRAYAVGHLWASLGDPREPAVEPA